MGRLKVSVALAAYDGERYIEEQMESLLAQTRPPDEVIIFDDCSSDNTAAIIKSFIEAHGLMAWRLFENPENTGFIENFARALQRASGDIIFLCDQDDIWLENKIEAMARIMEESSDILALNSAFAEIDGHGAPLKKRQRFFRYNNGLIRGRIKRGALKRIGYERVLWSNISPGCTAALTSELKDTYLSKRRGLAPHDWEINVFAAARGGLYFLNEPLTLYRLHAGNAIGLERRQFFSRLPAAGNNEERVKKARVDFDRAKAYVESAQGEGISKVHRKEIDKYLLITSARLRMLESGKLTAWFILLTHTPSYIKLKGIRGMLDDVVIVLRGN